MRGYQLINTFGEYAIDAGSNKLTVFTPMPGFFYNYRSDSVMATQPNRKVDLFFPPTSTKLLEIYMLLIGKGGVTTNSLAFKFNIVNMTSGVVSSTVATVNPVPMPIGTWQTIYDVRYDQAPTISAGQYLQAEFTGYGGGLSNTWGCQPFWRIGVAA
jgi:hypothetical protein